MHKLSEPGPNRMHLPKSSLAPGQEVRMQTQGPSQVPLMRLGKSNQSNGLKAWGTKPRQLECMIWIRCGAWPGAHESK